MGSTPEFVCPVHPQIVVHPAGAWRSFVGVASKSRAGGFDGE